MKQLNLKFLFVVVLACFAVSETHAQISTTNLYVRDTTIAPTSVAATAATDTVCSGETATINLTGGEPGTGKEWQWFDAPSASGTSLASGTTYTTSALTNTGTDPLVLTYYVTAVDTMTATNPYYSPTKCTYTRFDSAKVVVIPAPVFDVSGPDTLCAGETIAGDISTSNAGLTFSWSADATVGVTAGTDVAAGTGVIGGTAVAGATAFSTATITINADAYGTCQASKDYSLTVLPNITMAATNDKDTVCNGLAFQESVFSTTYTGGTITYDMTKTGTSTGSSPAAGTITSLAVYNGVNTTCADITETFEVTPKYTLGTKTCDGTPITITRTVRPTPNGTIVTNTPLCEGDVAQVTFTSSCGTGPFGLLINTSTTNAAGTAVNYTNQTSGTAFDISPQPNSGQTTYNLWRIEDANGCVREVTNP